MTGGAPSPCTGTGPAPRSLAWADVEPWRRAERARLLAARRADTGPGREDRCAAILGRLRGLFAQPAGRDIAFYWPYRGEIDLRPLAVELIAQGARAVLPVVVGRDEPLEFRRWQPGAALGRDELGIPVPAEGQVVWPDVVLAPLLGFDGANYRLGLGGGFFDRTLAQSARAPTTIGVGFELARLPTIHPQPHDVALDVIVTEAGIWPRDTEEEGG